MTAIALSNAEWLARRREAMRAKRLAAALAMPLTLAAVIDVTEQTIKSAVHDDTFVPSDHRQSQKLVERLLAAGERLSYDGLSDGARTYVDGLIRRGWITETTLNAAFALARADFEDWRDAGRDPRWRQ